jgi:hypothetical protein
MTSISRAQRLRCLTVMRQLAEFATFACFFRRPEANKTHPPTLDRIRANLMKDRYTTVTAWKADVKALWEGSLSSHAPDSLQATAGRQLQQTFTSLAERITDDESRDWTAELEAMNRRLARLTAARPPDLPAPVFVSAPRESPESPESDRSTEGEWERNRGVGA